jgi:hypothetical protein
VDNNNPMTGDEADVVVQQFEIFCLLQERRIREANTSHAHNHRYIIGGLDVTTAIEKELV